MNTQPSLILDIGSASLGACLTERHKKDKPELSRVKRVPVSSTAQKGHDALQTAVIQTLKTLLAEYQKIGSPHSVHVILASPWYQSHLKTIFSKSEKPIRVTRATLSHAVEKYRAKKATEEQLPHGQTSIESVVTQAYVNGYQTLIEKPLIGTTLKIELYESAADSAFLNLLTDAIQGVFHDAKISFHSVPLVSFVVLRSLRNEEGFTFIDIEGEVTDVAIVHKDGLRFLGSFPGGTKKLLADTAQGKSEAETASRLSLYARGELSADEGAGFAVGFAQAAALWNKDYEKMLETAVTDVPIPATAFLIADREEVAWFKKVIEINEKPLFPTHPIAVTPDFFQTAITLGNEGLYDAFLSLEALFFHIERKELIEVLRGDE